MSLQAIGSSERASPIREKEREKEEEIYLIEKTGEASGPVFSGIEERGSPVLQPIDRVVSIRTAPNPDLIHSIERGASAMYTRMLSEIKLHQENEKYRANGEVTIQAFMRFEDVRQRFEAGDRECYKELIAFLEMKHLGFHRENYLDENGVFSPEMFLGSAEATTQILSYAYGHARQNNLLPIFFQLALSDGGCFQARSGMIMKYGAMIDRPDAKKELLKELVKIYSARYSAHKLPVDLDKFLEFIQQQTGLSLGHFGIDCQNPREDTLIQELTLKKFFTSSSVDLIGAAFEHCLVWMMTSSGRNSFKRYIKEEMGDTLTGEQKSDKNLEKMIDRMIATYPEYPLNGYFEKAAKPVEKESKQESDVSIGNFFETEEE